MEHERDPAVQELVAAERIWRNLQTNVLALAAYSSAAIAGSPLAAGLVAAGWLIKTRRAALRDMIEDPPRTDYETLTVPRTPRFRLGALGDSALEMALKRFGEPTLLATGEIGAMVRALERRQGAELDGNVRWVQAQQDQFDRFRGWAIEHVAATADAGPALGEQISLATRDLQIASPSRVSGPLQDVLSSDTLARLYSWDVPRSFVERPTEIELPPVPGEVADGFSSDVPQAEAHTIEALTRIEPRPTV